jgi:N-acetylmuramoyl-L-alanine amidase
MRFFFIPFLIITALFSCNSNSLVSAYQSYNNAKQNYIAAILESNNKKMLYFLKEIIQCGDILGFDVTKYKKALKDATKKRIHKKIVKNPLKLQPIYIKVEKFNPLKIKLSNNMKVKYLTLYRDHKHYKIFDIYNAKVNHNIYKKIASGLYLKIVQNRPKRVRVVIYKNQKFKIKYFISKDYLKVTLFEKLPKHIPPKKIIYNDKPTPIISHKIIVIDPGHGGKDPGGIGFNGIKEKDVVLKIGLYLRNILQKRGYKVYMTRDKDYFVTLPNRTKFANRHHADLFISIHCNIIRNDSRVHGPTTYFLSPARTARASRVAKYENSAIGNLHTINQQIVLNFLNKDRIIQSDKMGMDIQRNIIYNLRKHYKDIYDRGVRPAPFWVLVGTQMPAILIETGFLTNKKEASRLNNSLYQKRLAIGIANGINSYFEKNR